MKTILIIAALLMAIVLLVYTYFGGFRKIRFRREKQGGETGVYRHAVGDYSKSGEVVNDVYHRLLADENIPTAKGFGIYYDNPKKVEKSRLRSDLGCIVEGLDAGQIKALSEKYDVMTLPEGDYMVTEFPYKGRMSVVMGMVKVYPALEKYCRGAGIPDESPVTEIYDVPRKKIVYRKQIRTSE